ncbi:hypothetical protein K1719_019304 [Acacia pycnantha]|nr:hypothetical protein K1719_019304 [Acacia pycnantha]
MTTLFGSDVELVPRQIVDPQFLSHMQKSFPNGQGLNHKGQKSVQNECTSFVDQRFGSGLWSSRVKVSNAFSN